MRETVERVFGCKAFDRYGCREAGDIACECQYHTGLHVFPWGCYVEVVDEDGRPVPPGVEGNILVTSLLNYAMPLIRYKLEDRGILAANVNCPCGRKGQFLQQVTGRAPDSFKTRTGRYVSGSFFSHLIGVDLNSGVIKQFQVIQEDYDRIRLRIVRHHEDEAVNVPPIKAAIEKAMGQGVELEVEYVDDIPPSPSGKYRYTISHVNP
jgi:phenylacetate-CoA ligase